MLPFFFLSVERAARSCAILWLSQPAAFQVPDGSRVSCGVKSVSRRLMHRQSACDCRGMCAYPVAKRARESNGARLEVDRPVATHMPIHNAKSTWRAEERPRALATLADRPCSLTSGWQRWPKRCQEPPGRRPIACYMVRMPVLASHVVANQPHQEHLIQQRDLAIPVQVGELKLLLRQRPIPMHVLHYQN